VYLPAAIIIEPPRCELSAAILSGAYWIFLSLTMAVNVVLTHNVHAEAYVRFSAD
jgi:hypothetical protein